MNFDRSMLSIEINKMLQTEKEMRRLYFSIAGKVKDGAVKEKLLFIMNQEDAHIKMVRKIIEILGSE